MKMQNAGEDVTLEELLAQIKEKSENIASAVAELEKLLEGVQE
jgi:hypothetical protein